MAFQYPHNLKAHQNVFTAIGGEAATIVTAAGGSAITLAASGAGELTTFAGSVYNVITSDIATATSTQTQNAALGLQAWSPSAPLFGGMLTVLASMFLGAWVAL